MCTENLHYILKQEKSPYLHLNHFYNAAFRMFLIWKHHWKSWLHVSAVMVLSSWLHLLLIDWHHSIRALDMFLLVSINLWNVFVFQHLDQWQTHEVYQLYLKKDFRGSGKQLQVGATNFLDNLAIFWVGRRGSCIFLWCYLWFYTTYHRCPYW